MSPLKKEDVTPKLVEAVGSKLNEVSGGKTEKQQSRIQRQALRLKRSLLNNRCSLLAKIPIDRIINFLLLTELRK